MAEEGSPEVEYQYKDRGPEPAPVVEAPAPEPRIELRKKLPPEETPLRADCNGLARLVIQNMKQRRPLTELENLEKNQLSK